MKHWVLISIALCAATVEPPEAQSQAAGGPVSFERLASARREPQNWLTYWGDYQGTRFRNLSQIDTTNVARLRVEWIYQTEQPWPFETVPLVADGVMYFTAANGFAFALDPKTGRELWRYQYKIPAKSAGCCGSINRGLAILGSRLFMVTADAHLVAIDARNGKALWDVAYAPNSKSYGGTLAPLAVKDKVIVGTGGGEFGARGFVAAFSADTGKELWRFWTVPGPGERGNETWGSDSWARGGASTWMTGTYDPELDLVYWGVGNPGPDLNGDVRPGDNLYSDCVIALEAATGKLRWYFQFTPHDTHDWDAAETPMLVDLNWQGRPRKLLLQANRNAFYYVLDRVTGEFLLARPFARQNWAEGVDAKGRPQLKPLKPTGADLGTYVCPGQAGATNWMAPSYEPKLGLFFLNVREQCDTFYSTPPLYKVGRPYIGGAQRGAQGEREYGLVTALDALSGEVKWQFRTNRAPWAGTMATAGGLLFAGDEDGYLMAFDAAKGNPLWKIYTGSELHSSPITYLHEGKQYITMPSGSALITFALPD